MELSELARKGFGSGADTYHRARPEYPRVALDHLHAALGLGPGARVLDLAAGTGRMSRHLVAWDCDVTAVEPSDAMRAEFTEGLPGVPLLAGTAEEIPADDGAFDAVVVAQAFHWFDGPVALREIARVLRPGGALGLIWNERDESLPEAARLSEVAGWTRNMPYDVGRDFRADLDASGLYAPAERRTTSWSDTLTHDQMTLRFSTLSYVNAMPAEERDALLVRVRAELARHPDPLDVPYLTDTFTARRLPS
ncbi:class I SAM-dependent methyltransferase [Yinghuangia seranimata]|uniref:class I SAM-dependent methyltransferase n=1 Tax=Yinghuangia seranimata TaxID=408067 RepID=UPI00248CAEE2|nr:class I SAM-dependent methyltransferase [Yinghuangia seranimata]MDI2125295.1 class I SAM-dependent methyltransferase [Yinghuangia seranimata]